MANTAPGRLQWTKSEFEKHADCEIADDFWKLVEDQLQVKPEDDSFFTLVVTQAKKAATDKKLRAENEKLLAEKEKQEKLLAEKEKLHHSEIKKIQAERDNAIQAAQKKSYLVLSVSAAAKDGSSRKEFREKQVAATQCRGGFIAQKFYLDFVLASREFPNFSVDEELKKQAIKDVEQLGMVLYRRIDSSLFGDAYLDEEGPQSAVAAELFQLAINMLQGKDEGADRLRVTHQQHIVARPSSSDFEHITISKKRSATGAEKTPSEKEDEKMTDDRVDVCIWFVHSEETLGSCVVASCEYKPNNVQEEARIAQADMYGSNIFLLHKKPCVVIDIIGGNDVSNWVVSARGLTTSFSPEMASFEKSELYSGKGPEAIVLVAWGLIKAKPSFPKLLDDFGSRLGPNVGSIDGCVYKVYDNSITRNPNVEVVQHITGDDTAELLESKDKRLKILKMKEFESNWKTTVDAKETFGSIISKLQILHKKHGPHGDIRLANLLSSGHIIDFDFVGKKTYPSTLNGISQDGRRHPDVMAMIAAGRTSTLEMKACHDWFSLSKVMELFQPVEESKLSDWENVCSLVRREMGTDAVKRLDDCKNIELKDSDIPLCGTGNTPLQKAKSKNKKARPTASPRHPFTLPETSSA